MKTPSRDRFSNWLQALTLCGLLLAVTAWASGPDASALFNDPTLPGGQTTVFVTNRHAFAKSAANLPMEQLPDFAYGNRLFNTNWIEAPASVRSFDGVGPVFNRNSCSGCHTRDGRGQPPESPDDPMISMLVRISLPGLGEHGGPRPDPVYGDQLQDRAITHVIPEGQARIHWQTIGGVYADGQPYQLRQPAITLSEPGYGSFDPQLLLSPRVAPMVFGLGLLEAIPQERLLQLADPDDADGDGISGRVNWTWDVAAGQQALGRFGWKANVPTILQQNAGAAHGDMGLTNRLFPYESISDPQRGQIEFISGGDPELSDRDLDKLTFYVSVLAPPARRNLDDPAVARGQALFHLANCHACHVPQHVTGPHAIPVLAHQSIYPYTDLLLHDMGDELADNRPDFQATGREWRTPPLWGLGLVETVNNHTTLLHDGRARSFEEAILWHGGEGQASRDAFRAMTSQQRADLVAFLKSL